MNKLQSISRRHYIKELFDPVQTHAVYGVMAEDLQAVKDTLAEAGAKRLRVVKVDKFLRIVCYKMRSTI